MKKYYYHVAYRHNSKERDGFGDTEIITDEEIVNRSQIDEVRNLIKQKNNFVVVIIINYQLMRAEEVSDSEGSK